MPAIVVDLKLSVVDKIQRLVNAGHYSSPGEFLEIAAANQLELENGRSERAGGRASGRAVARNAPGRTGVTGSVPQIEDPSVVRVMTRAVASRRGRGVTETELSAALDRLRAACDATPAAGLPLKPPLTAKGEGRIWGQVNRLLPLKVALRWLAAHSVREKEWARADALEPMAADAATIGTALEQVDADADRSRDELLATGLPRRGNALSMDRFLSQYLARTTRKGTIHPGAAIQYGLAFIEEDRLALTPTGFEFATMRNPIVDDNLESATTTLADDERKFFVLRAVPYLPSELQEFSLVLTFLAAGQNTPNDQLTLLREHLPAEWSDTMVRTHVTGVVARMVDLALLRRQWEGRRVQYEITPLAADFSRLQYPDPTTEGAPHA